MLAETISAEIYIGLPRHFQRHITHPIERLDLRFITDKLLPHFFLTDHELYSKSRLSHIVDARMIIIYLALKTGKYTLKKIGKVFNKDHSTIIYYREKVNDLMSVDKAYKVRVERAEELLYK